MKQLDENKFMKIVGSMALIVLAFSVCYHYVISPVLTRNRIDNCLDNLAIKQGQAEAGWKEKVQAHATTTGLYGAYQVREITGDYPSINTSKAQNECYKRYK